VAGTTGQTLRLSGSLGSVLVRALSSFSVTEPSGLTNFNFSSYSVLGVRVTRLPAQRQASLGAVRLRPVGHLAGVAATDAEPGRALLSRLFPGQYYRMPALYYAGLEA
jgi:hypothetical protein